METIDIHQEIAALRRSFIVQSIMVPVKRLKRATRPDTAGKLHNEYDVVPYPLRGAIRGYYLKTEQENVHSIEMADLLGGSTSLLDTIRLFENRFFYFVLYGNAISGFVHYSDLNHSNVRIPVFGLLQLLERRTWSLISKLIKVDGIRAVVTRSLPRIQRERQRNIDRNIDLGWANIFNLPEILRLARHYNRLQISEPEVKTLQLLRNKVAHPHNNLVNRHNELSKVIASINLLMRLLRAR